MAAPPQGPAGGIPPAPPQPPIPGGLPQQLHNAQQHANFVQWRKTVGDYTRNLTPCDGSNKSDLRNLLDIFDALIAWTGLPDNMCLTTLGFLTRDVLRESILAYIRTHPAGNWLDVKAYIQDTFLEDNELDYQRSQLERIQQGTFEEVRDYSQHYVKALARSYTAVQLQDPIHLERVIKGYVRGLNCGDVREKVYDSQPNTLQQAMDRAQACARSRRLRAERNGPNLDPEFRATRQKPAPARVEEPMDVGIFNLTPEDIDYVRLPAIKKTAAPPDDALVKQVDNLDRKFKGVQKQMTAFLRTQEAMKGQLDELLERGPSAARKNDKKPLPNRPDRRKWDSNGRPYCLQCGNLGHLRKDCHKAVSRPQPMLVAPIQQSVPGN